MSVVPASESSRLMNGLLTGFQECHGKHYVTLELVIAVRSKIVAQHRDFYLSAWTFSTEIPPICLNEGPRWNSPLKSPNENMTAVGSGCVAPSHL